MTGRLRGHNGHRRRELAAWLRTQGKPCHICNQAIDYSLPPSHPMSFSVDHIVPIARGGDEFSKDNIEAAHRLCNMKKSKRLDSELTAKNYVVSTVVEW